MKKKFHSTVFILFALFLCCNSIGASESLAQSENTSSLYEYLWNLEKPIFKASLPREVIPLSISYPSMNDTFHGNFWIWKNRIPVQDNQTPFFLGRLFKYQDIKALKGYWNISDPFVRVTQDGNRVFFTKQDNPELISLMIADLQAQGEFDIITQLENKPIVFGHINDGIDLTIINEHLAIVFPSWLFDNGWISIYSDKNQYRTISSLYDVTELNNRLNDLSFDTIFEPINIVGFFRDFEISNDQRFIIMTGEFGNEVKPLPNYNSLGSYAEKMGYGTNLLDTFQTGANIQELFIAPLECFLRGNCAPKLITLQDMLNNPSPFDPIISPNNQKLAYFSEGSFGGEVTILSIKNGKPSLKNYQIFNIRSKSLIPSWILSNSTITTNPFELIWSPDSRYLAFTLATIDFKDERAIKNDIWQTDVFILDTQTDKLFQVTTTKYENEILIDWQ